MVTRKPSDTETAGIGGGGPSRAEGPHPEGGDREDEVPFALAGIEEVKRSHAFEVVFEQIATAVLRKEIAPGTPLPSERILAQKFGVSRTVIRQAVHKLEDCGLVRVRQGGATTVLDGSSSTNMHVIELRYRVGPRDDRERREMAERRILQGFSLVFLASMRASRESLDRLAAVVDAYATRGAPPGDLPDFERQIWQGLADAADNRLYVNEVAWWFRVSEGRSADASSFLNPAARASFYKELFRRLLARDNAPRFYLDVMGPLLEAGVVHSGL
jgi:DNA-binding FadR family transcriptional regulator